MEDLFLLCVKFDVGCGGRRLQDPSACLAGKREGEHAIAMGLVDVPVVRPEHPVEAPVRKYRVLLVVHSRVLGGEAQLAGGQRPPACGVTYSVRTWH